MLAMHAFQVLIVMAIAGYGVGPAGDASNALCAEREVYVGSLEKGKMLQVPFGSERVGIYRRTDIDVQGLMSNQASQFNGGVPGWWPREKMPLSNESLHISPLRSKVPGLFVYWIPSPVYGCYVIHAPLGSELATSIARGWTGGFFDPCEGTGYDYSGRPVPAALDIETPKELQALPLCLPSYRIDKNATTIILECS